MGGPTLFDMPEQETWMDERGAVHFRDWDKQIETITPVDQRALHYASQPENGSF